MENRDLLMKQIEVFGENLRRILFKVSLLKESEATDIQVAEIDDLMRSGIGLDLNDIASVTNESFLTGLLEKKHSAADLSIIVNLLVDLATITRETPNNYDVNQLLSKALFLGDYLTTNQKAVYFGNIAALDKAGRLLNDKD